MEIVFLGTGAAEGIPGFRCVCLVCSEARIRKGRHIRQNSAIYLKTDSGNNVLVDMPPQIKPMLEKYKITDTDISTILISHFHEDHINGIFHLIECKKTNGHIAEKPVEVYMPQYCLKRISEIFTPDNHYYTLNSRSHLDKTELPGLTVTALDTSHLAGYSGSTVNLECHGYLFCGDGKNTAYMVDASSHLPDSTVEKLTSQKLDCLIYECTFDKIPGSSRSHTDHEGVIRIRDLLKPEKMIITHISHRNLGHEKLSRYMAGFGIETAWDGMKVRI